MEFQRLLDVQPGSSQFPVLYWNKLPLHQWNRAKVTRELGQNKWRPPKINFNRATTYGDHGDQNRQENLMYQSHVIAWRMAALTSRATAMSCTGHSTGSSARSWPHKMSDGNWKNDRIRKSSACLAHVKRMSGACQAVQPKKFFAVDIQTHPDIGLQTSNHITRLG